MIVIDSGVVIAALLRDEHLHSHARRLIARLQNDAESWTAPALLRSEVVAVLRKTVYQRRITYEEGMSFVREALLLRVELVNDVDLFESAYEIARDLGFVRTYDTQYPALARRHDCEFWTADLRLVNTAERLFPKVRWLGDLS